MTTSLKKVIDGLNKLPSAEQNAIAELLIELTWKSSYENSQNLLASLAAEAEIENITKKTKPFKLK